mmetsp:Transcript_2209/g.5212  ORF Transcript_2209/g.5212 Transcript_2209/m.5212 type:complete len:508 (-) Transcript_2209:715-2238(-)
MGASQSHYDPAVVVINQTGGCSGGGDCSDMCGTPVFSSDPNRVDQRLYQAGLSPHQYQGGMDAVNKRVLGRYPCLLSHKLWLVSIPICIMGSVMMAFIKEEEIECTASGGTTNGVCRVHSSERYYLYDQDDPSNGSTTTPSAEPTTCCAIYCCDSDDRRILLASPSGTGDGVHGEAMSGWDATSSVSAWEEHEEKAALVAQEAGSSVLLAAAASAAAAGKSSLAQGIPDASVFRVLNARKRTGTARGLTTAGTDTTPPPPAAGTYVTTPGQCKLEQPDERRMRRKCGCKTERRMLFAPGDYEDDEVESAEGAARELRGGGGKRETCSGQRKILGPHKQHPFVWWPILVGVLCYIAAISPLFWHIYVKCNLEKEIQPILEQHWNAGRNWNVAFKFKYYSGDKHSQAGLRVFLPMGAVPHPGGAPGSYRGGPAGAYTYNQYAEGEAANPYGNTPVVGAPQPAMNFPPGQVMQSVDPKTGQVQYFRMQPDDYGGTKPVPISEAEAKGNNK